MIEWRKTEYGGWDNCLVGKWGALELVVTLDVGPRIISLRVDEGPNLFKTFDEELGQTSGEEFALFGGHRLWHAPEVHPRSWVPDFEPVPHRFDEGFLVLEPPTEPDTGIRKSMWIRGEDSGRIRVRHCLANTLAWAVELAPWAMSLMAPGGRAIIPQEDYRTHPEHLYPARTVTLWHFTRMNDPRVRWGERYIQLREDPAVDQKIKFGVLNKQRWAAYENRGSVFVKTFGFLEEATYADMGCNFETFTMPGFLELESLGPLQRIEPGATAVHDEIWHVRSGVRLPSDGDALHQAMQDIVAGLAFP
ncbi:hypothetical protein [Elongatibacter sediminis]|uniref:DUF4432 domain-containing protein n=1 Tax=Elongatibacter sediminis TaxID=3119006 RepID=A0AAW9RD56_9GAMM